MKDAVDVLNGEIERLRQQLNESDHCLGHALKREDVLRQRVAELEVTCAAHRDQLDMADMVIKERGERMKKICQWLEYPSFEARQDWHDVKDKWFDETGEPL